MQWMLQCVQNELYDSGSYNDKKANDDQKGRASLNADDLIKKKILINELTSSSFKKDLQICIHVRTHYL